MNKIVIGSGETGCSWVKCYEFNLQLLKENGYYHYNRYNWNPYISENFNSYLIHHLLFDIDILVFKDSDLYKSIEEYLVSQEKNEFEFINSLNKIILSKLNIEEFYSFLRYMKDDIIEEGKELKIKEFKQIFNL